MNRIITGKTKLTGLIGQPVAHSISPMMHNMAFEILGLDYVYLCFDVGEKELPAAVQGLLAVNARGFNVTMPHKNRIVEFMDELSPAASLIGAVNTVVNEEGRLIGHNTDGLGFMRAVADAGYSISGKTVTLMGAGGASTAICAQAALDGVQTIHLFVRPTSRYRERMEQLAKKINATLPAEVLLHDHGDETALRQSLEASTMLINATSVGMAPDTDACILPDASYLHPTLTVADVIYHPSETKLLQMARAAGCGAFNGLYMLLYQGAEAFRLWTGQAMPTESIKAAYFQL